MYGTGRLLLLTIQIKIYRLYTFEILFFKEYKCINLSMLGNKHIEFIGGWLMFSSWSRLKIDNLNFLLNIDI